MRSVCAFRLALYTLLLLGLTAPADAAQDGEHLDLGGAMRFQYVYRDWQPSNRDKLGDIEMDTFLLKADAEYQGLKLSAEYRWYPSMDVIHHGWIGYQLDKHWEGQVGINKVPFGVLPYASHNFFFSSNYYLGLEDDYDSGVKAKYRAGRWRGALAFYKNPEYGPGTNARYSFDVVNNPAQNRFNEETNQLNGWLAYRFGAAEGDRTQLGLSAQAGQLYNSATGRNGSHWAAALHVDAHRGPWNLQAQLTHYRYAPQNPPGVDGSRIQMGAYATYYAIPAEATSTVLNLAYDLPVDMGPVNTLRFYLDNSLVSDKDADLPDTRMHVLGVGIDAGKVYSYLDLVYARNQPFIGGSLAPDAGSDTSWNTRVNWHVGYYF